MTEYARPSGREQIVRLNPGQKTGAAARPAFDHLRASIAEIGDGTCLEFATSRRTGNIEITLSAETSRLAAVHRASGASIEGDTASKVLDARPKPHVAMPEATGDFCDDLHTYDTDVATTARDATIEDLMAGTGKGPEAARRVSSPMGHGGVDVRLARIIEAWPQLPARTRAAMIALLSRGDQAEGPTYVPADRPPTLRPVRVKEARTKDPGGPRRRGSRRSAGPPS